MKSETRDFLLKEYSHLRSEILDALKEVPANEKWALITSGVFWTWLASFNENPQYIAVTVWIPAGLTFLLFLRWRALEKKFGTYGEYIRGVEWDLKLEGLGWETYIRKTGKHWFRIYGWAFWVLLFLGNLFLANLASPR